MYNKFSAKHKKMTNRMVREAVEKGLLPAIGPCIWCGTTQNIVKHHNDYKHPLNVVFMCQSCHSTIHNKAKRILKAKKQMPDAEAVISSVDGYFEVTGYDKSLCWFKTEQEAVKFVHEYLDNQIDMTFYR